MPTAYVRMWLIPGLILFLAGSAFPQDRRILEPKEERHEILRMDLTRTFYPIWSSRGLLFFENCIGRTVTTDAAR